MCLIFIGGGLAAPRVCCSGYLLIPFRELNRTSNKRRESLPLPLLRTHCASFPAVRSCRYPPSARRRLQYSRMMSSWSHTLFGWLLWSYLSWKYARCMYGFLSDLHFQWRTIFVDSILKRTSFPSVNVHFLVPTGFQYLRRTFIRCLLECLREAHLHNVLKT